MAELKRALGLWPAVSIVVGTVIGSGIFLVPKAMINAVGSPRMVFFIWVFGGLLSLAGALTYAELASAIPEAGGEYAYLREAYGPMWAFIYGWTQMWVAKSGSIATLATGFFYYLANFYPNLEGKFFVIPLPIGANGGPLDVSYGQILAMAVILLLALVNYFGVRFGGNVQVAVTAVKIVLIAGVVVIGLLAPQGTFQNLSTSTAAIGGISGFFAALVAALWAYDGWNNVAMISSEIRNPRKDLPRALILGTASVILVYLFANLAYFYVLSSGEVGATDRVAAAMMRKVMGAPGAGIVSLAAMISIFAALNGSILTGARVPYAMARDGLFFRSIGVVHPRWFTPSNSILALSFWSALLVLSGRYDQLFTYVIFSSWILYGMAAASVVVLRRKRPDLDRPYRTWGYPFVPVLFVLAAAALLASTLRTSPRESLMGICIILAGLPFYARWKKRLSRIIATA
ncbi:MAG: Serine/threonine exchanger SteT [Bryobacteraceae bacterium]|nr:Serine/threonine exchanger SteT [Bryobacteraceae bacterium]